MNDNHDRARLKTFCIDFVAIVLSFLIFLIITTILSIAITGSRENGMGFGLISGLVLSIVAFYYLRGQFNFIWTIIQIIVNGGLTVGEFLVISFLFEDTEIAEVSYGYLLILISVPTFV